MEHREFIERLVLNEICDDYENVDQIILPAIACEGVRHGFTVERSEIVEALAALIESGMAKAYILSSRPPHATELEGMPDISNIEEDFHTYFWATPDGIAFHVADDSWWPYGEDAE